MCCLNAGVAVGDVGEGEVEVGAERVVERRGPGGERVDLRRRAGSSSRCPSSCPRPTGGTRAARSARAGRAAGRSPARSRTRCSGGRPAAASPVLATDGRDRVGVVGRAGRLLDVAPQVRLDVEDDRSCRAGGPLEEQAQVGVVGGHRRGVGQVGEVLRGLAAAGRRVRLEEHVVREDRGHAVGHRVLRRTSVTNCAVGVPGRPAVARVDATGEVLVAELERGGGTERGGAAGRVGETELDAVRRPGWRQRREWIGRSHRRDRDRQQAGDDERDERFPQTSDGRVPQRPRIVPDVAVDVTGSGVRVLGVRWASMFRGPGAPASHPRPGP